ncbi:hypothetical protein P5V15_004667 [Pogonomyrmex californicus]
MYGTNNWRDHLDESFETYLEKTKQAFSGKNADIQFFLEDDIFMWKQQNIVTRGKIIMHSLSNILILSDILKQLLELYQKCQERVLTLENENEHLSKANTKLITDIEEMINMKTTMEKDLYMRFLLLLNTKKKKIRELQKALDNNKKTTKSVFDETTDEESEGSDVDDSKKIHDPKSSRTRKHKMDCSESEQEFIPKNSEKNFKKSMRFSSSEDTSPEPSTSKSNLILQDTRIIKSKQANCLSSSPESMEDMFS